MSAPAYFSFPGPLGEKLKTEAHYSTAVRVGNVVKTSGQVGWDRETEKKSDDWVEEVDQVFDNVQAALEAAGSKGWSEVYQVRAFVVGMANLDPGHIIVNLKKWCPDHQPLLTVIGVEKLYFEFRLEIEVEAYIV